jgi:hypothetical protein
MADYVLERLENRTIDDETDDLLALGPKLYALGDPVESHKPTQTERQVALTHPEMGALRDRLGALLTAYLAEGCDPDRSMTTAEWQGVSAALEAAVHCMGDLEFVQLTSDAWSTGTGVRGSLLPPNPRSRSPRIHYRSGLRPLPSHPKPFGLLIDDLPRVCRT